MSEKKDDISTQNEDVVENTPTSVDQSETVVNDKTIEEQNKEEKETTSDEVMTSSGTEVSQESEVKSMDTASEAKKEGSSVSNNTPKSTSNKSNLILFGVGGLLIGAAIGVAGYSSFSNGTIVSGGGVHLNKVAVADQLTSNNSEILFDVAKSEALQALYPQKDLGSNAHAKKSAQKFLNEYIKNNGGEKAVKAQLKTQGTTLAKWKASMMTQAIAQVKSNAEAKQSLDVIKDAKVVSTKEVNTSMKNYKQYVTEAFLVKNADDAKKLVAAINDADKKTDKLDSKLYEQHQDKLKVSTVDTNSDSAEVLAKLKDAKKGDVVQVDMANGSGSYVFIVNNIYSYQDYKQNDDKQGMKQIKKAVTMSLTQQAASTSTTLGKAQAKVLKAHGVHFKDGDLDKQFYESLKSPAQGMMG